MAVRRPRIEVMLVNRDRADQARQSLREAFGDRVELVTGGGGGANVRLVALEDLPASYPGPDSIVAVGDPTLPELVSLFAARPWLNHVISPSHFSGGAFPAALWQLCGRRPSGGNFLGDSFRGRKASLRDSKRRAERVEAIISAAREGGATSRAQERVADLAEELLSNALYNAPAELHGRPVNRTVAVELPPEEACSVTYGVSGPLFVLRVKDRCGSLKRERLLEVLKRCAAQSEVTIDHSRGGAGLGMWRIFSQSSLLIIRVEPNRFTDFIAGVDLKARRASEEVRREVHLFMERG